MGGSASSSPAVQKSLANFMDAALSTTVDGLRSTGKRIKKGNAALSDAMSDAYDEVNLLDPARQIGLTSQGRGDPSIMRSINTPLVAGAQMGLGAANAAYRGTANLLGQGVEGVRSALPKSLSDYVGTGAQFERDFNAMPEFLAGTGFGLIPASVPPIAKGFAEGTSVRNAERGMFAGVGAKTADLEALKVAKKLETDGIDRDAIWGQTGWGRGKDNKWRFEIDDSGATFNDAKNYGEGLGNEYGMLRHPQIETAYPSSDALYFKRQRSDKLVSGSYTPGWSGDKNYAGLAPEISITAPDAISAKPTALHEVQHYLQEKEKFDLGSSPNSFSSGPMFDENIGNMTSDFSKVMTGGYGGKPAEWMGSIKDADINILKQIAKLYGFNKVDDALEAISKADIDRTPFGQYRRVAGEVEARNVETRMNMTPAERLLTPPWKTEDVARDKQIVRFGGGKSMSLPTDNLPMDEASRNLVRLPNEIDAKKLNEVMEEMKVLGRPRIDVVDTGEEYLALEGSHRLTAAHKLGIKPIYNIVDQNAIINPNKYDVDTYNFKWDEDSPHSAGEMAFEMYGDGKNGRLDFGKLPNDLPMDEASRMGSDKSFRAVKGGEVGVNGYTYKGGQFLPNTEAPPGTWRVKSAGKSINIPNGQELIAPGVMQPRPTPFSRSIYQVMSGGTYTNIDKAGIASVNPRINWDYVGSTPDIKSEIRFKNLAKSKETFSQNDLIEMYNKGVRWIDLDPVDGVEIVAKGAK